MSSSGVSEQQTDEFREFVRNRKEFFEYMKKEKTPGVPDEGERSPSPQRKPAGKPAVAKPEATPAPGPQA